MLFVGDLWVVLTHEYYKVSIHATHNQFFHLTITEESVSQGKDLISARIYALTEDPKEPLEQVDILGNHPYLVGSLSFLMKCSFTMEIICISHISYQLSFFFFFSSLCFLHLLVLEWQLSPRFHAPTVSPHLVSRMSPRGARGTYFAVPMLGPRS